MSAPGSMPDSAVALDALHATEELRRRKGRAPDFQAENEALLELVRALNDEDARLLQKLAEATLRLCQAHSAGVSIEEEEQGRKVLRSRGAAGRWSLFLGETLPRTASPCGTVLSSNAPLLMAYPERHFSCLEARVIPVVEMLLVPFMVAGATVGTVWVMLHDSTRRFDREDLRLLTNLSECASVAHQALQRSAQVRESLSRERLGSQLLQAISAGLMREADSNALYTQIIEAAVTIMRADSAALYTYGDGELQLVESRGLHAQSARFWQRVHPREGSAWAGTLRRGGRVIMADIERSPVTGSRADHAEFRRSGMRALQSAPLTSRSGELVGVLSTLWRVPHEPTAEELRLLDVLARLAADLLERARTDQALRDMDRRKNEFLAVLSHELRNPLAPITTGLELLRRPDNTPERIQSIHSMMYRQVSHLTRLVNDLLDLSRITRGTIELQRRPLELRVVIESAVELARPLIDQRRHALTLEHPEGSLAVDGDLERLTQVVANVLGNAAKYTDPGGQIHLGASREGGLAAIRIRDSGIGIPAGKLEEVFEMFTQVAEHRACSGGGLGIGLALSRRLIELHGGSIEARSEGLGKGSEFVIRLPLAASIEVADPPVPVREPSRGLLVLIIEDNVDAAGTLRLALESSGHTVLVAHDGPTGLAGLDTIAADVVLLDIGLPGVDGYDVARQIRSTPRGQRIRLIAVTGWGQQSDRERARAAGFDAHLTKPVSLEELNAVMNGAT